MIRIATENATGDMIDNIFVRNAELAKTYIPANIYNTKIANNTPAVIDLTMAVIKYAIDNTLNDQMKNYNRDNEKLRGIKKTIYNFFLTNAPRRTILT
jgi:hypothetical protein